MADATATTDTTTAINVDECLQDCWKLPKDIQEGLTSFKCTAPFYPKGWVIQCAARIAGLPETEAETETESEWPPCGKTKSDANDEQMEEMSKFILRLIISARNVTAHKVLDAAVKSAAKQVVHWAVALALWWDPSDESLRDQAVKWLTECNLYFAALLLTQHQNRKKRSCQKKKQDRDRQERLVKNIEDICSELLDQTSYQLLKLEQILPAWSNSKLIWNLNQNPCQALAGVKPDPKFNELQGPYHHAAFPVVQMRPSQS
eukprot:359054-Chlamydomonas_euryale.AAC.6